MPIIRSLLDTDFYILTMMQAIFHRCTNTHTKFEFKWRNWDKMKMRIQLKGFLHFVEQELDQGVVGKLQDAPRSQIYIR